MLPADACRVTGVLMDELAPGVWRAQLPNGHRLVARLRRRELERGRGRGLGPGRAVPLWVTPADMSQALVVWEELEPLESVKS